MKSSERKRLMRMGKPKPVSHETIRDVKKVLLRILDHGISNSSIRLYDDEREVLKAQRDRVAKFLGIE